MSKGTVKFFNEAKGFGFIIEEGSNEEHFVHVSGLIDEIKEDKLGNIYFVSANATSAISMFNGKTFTTLKAVPSKNWKLESTDMWFRYSYENEKKIYRYDNFSIRKTLPSATY